MGSPGWDRRVGAGLAGICGLGALARRGQRGWGIMMVLNVFYTTWPDRPTALAAAETLVAERLAACCNLLGESLSVYRWEGAVRREPEWVMLVKTVSARAEAALLRLAELHPYSTPAIIALGVDDALSHAGYAVWASDQTNAAGA